MSSWWDRAQVISSVAIGAGVGWSVWSHYGFLWGLLYGLFWEVWVGYRLAEWLLAGGR